MSLSPSFAAGWLLSLQIFAPSAPILTVCLSEVCSKQCISSGCAQCCFCSVCMLKDDDPHLPLNYSEQQQYLLSQYPNRGGSRPICWSLSASGTLNNELQIRGGMRCLMATPPANDILKTALACIPMPFAPFWASHVPKTYKHLVSA
jgi:hypothetical protein